jgi:thiol-disulfide isomerase/thioredoxin
MRLILAAALALTGGIFLALASPKKPAEDKTPRAEKLEELEKNFDKDLEELRKRFNAAKTDAELKGIREEAKELATLTSGKAIKIAEEDPKDATGFAAARFVIEKTGMFGGGKDYDTAVSIITEHHLNDPQVKAMIPRIGMSGQAGVKFLELAAEKSTDKEVRATAYFFLGANAAKQLEDVEDEKATDELIATATKFFEKARKEAPMAPLGGSTIGSQVTGELEAIAAIKNLAIGKPVPDVQGTNLEDKKVKLSSYHGKVVLLDVWATWCGPCRAMIPHERELVKKMKDKPFVLLSVSCDNQKEKLEQFLAKEPMPWDHWFDGNDGTVARSFRVRAFPTLYLIDHTGVIRNKWVGAPDKDKLDKIIEDLVKKAEKAKG